MTARRGARKPKEVDEEITREEWELVQFLEDSGGSVARVYVYRVQKNGEVEWIDTTQPEGMTEETLRDAYGPGKYELKFKGTNQKFLASKRIIIGETKPGASAAAGHGTQNGGGMSGPDFQLRILETQMASQSKMYETIIAAMAGNKQAGPDPTAMLTAVIGAFATLKGAVAPAGAAPADELEKLKTVIEIVQGLTGNGPEKEAAEDNLYSVLKSVAGQVVDIARPAIESAARGAAGAAPGAPAVRSLPETLPAGAPAAGAASGAVGDPAAGGDLLMNGKTQIEWLKTGLGYLKDKAKRNIDVALCVDWIFVNEHEPQNSVLLGAVQQGYTFPQLLAFDPEIEKDPAMRQWFSNLYDEIHKAIFEPDSAAPTGAVDTGGAAGDGGNAPGNEASGTGGPDKSVSVDGGKPV